MIETTELVVQTKTFGVRHWVLEGSTGTETIFSNILISFRPYRKLSSAKQVFFFFFSFFFISIPLKRMGL